MAIYIPRIWDRVSANKMCKQSKFKRPQCFRFFISSSIHLPFYLFPCHQEYAFEICFHFTFLSPFTKQLTGLSLSFIARKSLSMYINICLVVFSRFRTNFNIFWLFDSWIYLWYLMLKATPFSMKLQCTQRSHIHCMHAHKQFNLSV